jgi:hypothetical protein
MWCGSGLTAELVERLLDHAACVYALSLGVDEFAGDDIDDFILGSFEFGIALFFANLQFAVLENVYYYGFDGLLGECFFEIGFRCGLAFGDVEEDIFDLQDVREICLDAVAVLEDFVLVAGYLEALLA